MYELRHPGRRKPSVVARHHTLTATAAAFCAWLAARQEAGDQAPRYEVVRVANLGPKTPHRLTARERDEFLAAVATEAPRHNLRIPGVGVP